MKIQKESLPGTRDFYPNEMLVRNWLLDTWKNVSKLFGYREYDAPILERNELYTIKNNNDDILKEMFTFNHDGHELSLRPEITPQLVRLMLSYLPHKK